MTTAAILWMIAAMIQCAFAAHAFAKKNWFGAAWATGMFLLALVMVAVRAHS